MEHISASNGYLGSFESFDADKYADTGVNNHLMRIRGVCNDPSASNLQIARRDIQDLAIYHAV